MEQEMQDHNGFRVLHGMEERLISIEAMQGQRGSRKNFTPLW